jgi:hypothetical protein
LSSIDGYQDYETAANYICTFLELDAKMASHKELFADGQENVQRKVSLHCRQEGLMHDLNT